MKITVGKKVNVFDKFEGKDISCKVGTVEKIDLQNNFNFPVLVKFNDGGSGHFSLLQIGSHADS